jgi:hypothetical protein
MVQVVSELDLVATRLIGEQDELYSAVDRLRAEAQFRLAIIPPLLIVIIVLTVISTYFWLIGLSLLLLYFVQAVQREREAADLLVDAMFIDRVDSPTLERIQRAAKEFKERVQAEQAAPPAFHEDRT